MLPGGMSQISNHLASTLDVSGPLDVRRNHVVTKIEHRQDNCTVSYYEGNQANKIKTMVGSACFCTIPLTIPLGVLMGDGDQEGDVTFEPELSAKKQVAIKTRGYGHQNFAMIQFDTPFWRDQDPGKTSCSWVKSRQQCDWKLVWSLSTSMSSLTSRLSNKTMITMYWQVFGRLISIGQSLSPMVR